MFNKIDRLKAQARKHYQAYFYGGGDLSCGHALADHIRPRKAEHARKFNEVMEKLAALDPSCPAERIQL